MRFAVGSFMLVGETMREKFEAAKRIGFDGVEPIGRDFEQTMPQIAAAAEATGMPVSTICAGFRGSPIAPDRVEREQAMADIEALLGWAGRLGAVGVIVVPTFGRLLLPDLSPHRSARRLATDLLLTQLERLDRAAAKAGAVVILEPLSRGETRFINRLAQAREILELAGKPDGVKLMGDTFHMNSEETDPPAALRASAEHLVHIHLADNTRGQPGSGIVDFAAHFAALKAIGYAGWAALEYFPDGEDVEAGLARTLTYLRATYAQA